MTAPKRIQQRRTKGWRKPEGAVAVGRQTKWGNPFRVVRAPNWPRWAGYTPFVVVDRENKSWPVPDNDKPIVGRAAAEAASKTRASQTAVHLFALHIGPMGNYEYDAEDLGRLRAELAGKDLMCWCPLPEPGQPDHCHAAVLIELANTPEGLPS